EPPRLKGINQTPEAYQCRDTRHSGTLELTPESGFDGCPVHLGPPLGQMPGLFRFQHRSDDESKILLPHPRNIGQTDRTHYLPLLTTSLTISKQRIEHDKGCRSDTDR